MKQTTSASCSIAPDSRRSESCGRRCSPPRCSGARDSCEIATTGDVENRQRGEISYISRSLKALAKGLDVPVVAISQRVARAGAARPANTAATALGSA